MNLLFVGDVVGSPGRRALQDALLPLIDKRRIDFNWSGPDLTFRVAPVGTLPS